MLLPGVVPKLDKVKEASIVHSWIYKGFEKRRFNRFQADRIFFDAALETGFPLWRTALAYLGLTIAGWYVWEGS